MGERWWGTLVTSATMLRSLTQNRWKPAKEGRRPRERWSVDTGPYSQSNWRRRAFRGQAVGDGLGQVADEGTTVREDTRFASCGGAPKPYPISSSDVKNFHCVPNAVCKLYGCNQEYRQFFARARKPDQRDKKTAHVQDIGFDFTRYIRSLSICLESSEHPVFFGASTEYTSICYI